MRVRSALMVIPLVSLAALLSAAPTWAQFPSVGHFEKETEQRLPVDYARFASDSADLVRLELYCQIYNHLLVFVTADQEWEAHYELSVVVNDRHGKRMAANVQDKKIRAAGERQARSSQDYRIKQFNFDLPPGKYIVYFTLRDKNANTTLTRDLEVELNDLVADHPTMSDIELVRLARQGAETADVFTKGDVTLVPSVTGEFGGERGGALTYYVEIYRGRALTEDVRLETLVRVKDKSMVYRDSVTVSLSEPRVRHSQEIAVSGLRPGAYELEITLMGRRNKKLDFARKDFRVEWTTSALLEHDFETAVGQLAYIASREEIDRLKKSKSAEERAAAFNEFWRAKDPTPETPANEFKTEFYRRVEAANKRFTRLGRAGWRSDRGRVYILYGEPDQIDDYPLNLEGHPYQEWHYYRQGAYRKFTFVDEFDDGDYRLAFPYDGLNLRPEF